MPITFKKEWFYRIIVVFGFVITIALVFIVPDRFKEPDDWAYRYATKNLSHGRLTVDNALHQQQVAEAQKQGGQLGQYVQIGPDKWAFEKTPGYAYFLAPFYLLGIPQLANILLAVALVLLTFILLKRLMGERAACIGSLLILFNPVSLAMLQREFMDSYASLALPGIGGGLYALFCLNKSVLKPRIAACMLFMSGLFLGMGVATRYTDAVIIAVFALHFLVIQIQTLRTGQCSSVLREGLMFGLGAAIPLGLLMAYQNSVFGAPFTYGYEYTKGNVKFAYDYLGEPRAWQIIGDNLKNMWRPLITGFPLLLAAVPGMILLFWQKVSAVVPALRRYQGKTEMQTLSKDITFLMAGWWGAIFGLYMMYEWTTNQRSSGPFIIVTRFYMPALLPLVVLAVYGIIRLPNKVVIGLMAVAMAVGAALFVHASGGELKAGQHSPLSQNGLPAQSPTPERSWLIEQVRAEVKETPTNASNMQKRLDVMVSWIGELSSQKNLAGQLIPKDEVQRIRDLVLQNKATEAGRLIDEAYRKLEQLVISNPQG